MLWTRLAGDLDDEVEVAWELADDADFATVTATGTVTARAADAHSVHVVAELAGPSWYRFRAGGFTSPAGRAAPVGTGVDAAPGRGVVPELGGRLLRRPP